MTEQEWYSPGTIKFTRLHALWLIHNLGVLHSGYWPQEASNYVDTFSKRTKSKASFVNPIEYAAEIESRLQKCGIDGLILLAIECWGLSDGSLSEYFGLPEWSIRKRAKNALAYVASGAARRWHNTPKRKGKTYREFLKKEEKHAAGGNYVSLCL